MKVGMISRILDKELYFYVQNINVWR